MVGSTNQGGRYSSGIGFLVFRISGLYITDKMDAHWHLGDKGRQHFETALKRKRAESAVSQERGAGQNPRQ